MKHDTQNHVYHGSPYSMEGEIKPKRHTRIGLKGEVIFDDISFHATAHYWIGLAYTHDRRHFREIKGEKVHYNMGTSLYEHNYTVFIDGFDSLRKSLQVLYGNEGFVYVFDEKDFFHTKGLGNLEVITTDSVSPLFIKEIKNPVKEMKKAGVRFVFTDQSKL